MAVLDDFSPDSPPLAEDRDGSGSWNYLCGLVVVDCLTFALSLRNITARTWK